MLAIVIILSFYENKIKYNVLIEKIKKTNENLNKLTDKDVGIVYLPPMYVDMLTQKEKAAKAKRITYY